MAIALPALLGLARPTYAATPRHELRAGALTASVETDPFRLTFKVDGRPILHGLNGGGLDPFGSLSFTTAAPSPIGSQPVDEPAAGLWRHATRAEKVDRDGDALRVLVATDDPLGRRLDVTVRRTGDGVVSVRVAPVAGATRLAAAFGSPPSERFLGFGARSNTVDHAGTNVESWAAEGAWVPRDRPFIPPFVMPWSYSARDDGAYFPMPWFVSDRGYGFLLDNTERSLFRLRTDRASAWAVQADAPHLSFRVFAGPRPIDVVRRFSAAVGRQPSPRAPWVLGPWFQPTGDEGDALPGRFRAADVPGSLVMTYTHYLPCGDHVGNQGAERSRVRGWHAQGYAVTTYFNPMVCFSYQPAFADAAAAGALLRNAAGVPYPIHYNEFVVAQVDFTSPSGRAFYERLLDEAIADGHDGWMEDFGEYTPPDAVGADGTVGTALHNRYPVDYHCAADARTRRAGRPIVPFARSGYTGSARCSPVVWGGDPTTDWSFDGLPGAVRQGLNLGWSGVGIYGSDIGGFFSVSAPPTTPELLIRWLEAGAFSGVMRTQANGFTTPQWQQARAQVWDAGVQPVWRRYAKLRTQLYPYIAAAADAYVRTGMPMMADVGLVHPGDTASWTGPLRYLFGPELLVAPVVEPGARTHRVPLPPGRWRAFWDTVSYAEKDGSFHLRAARARSGGSVADVAAPLERIPVFVRAGALLPMLTPDVDTLASTGTQPGLVHLDDRDDRLRLLAWPEGSRNADALGARLRSRASPSSWRLDVGGRELSQIDIEAQLPFVPAAVRWNGTTVPRSAWRVVDGVFHMTLRGRGVLDVS